MSTSRSDSSPVRTERPVIIDIVRAFEGTLLGLVIVVLAAALSGTVDNLSTFAAVIVLPAVLMVLFMHLGAPPRRLFLLRAAGALLGWGLSWGVFIPLFVALSYAVFSAAAASLVYVTIAVVDGLLLALCITAVDRLANRLRPRPSADA